MGGFLVALTSFLTTYATSKKQALQHGYHIDASQVRGERGEVTCGIESNMEGLSNENSDIIYYNMV
jgi:phosphoribosyl-ATP pyrophosphohydrolase